MAWCDCGEPDVFRLAMENTPKHPGVDQVHFLRARLGTVAVTETQFLARLANIGW
jgi:hypothetical protein